MILIGHSWGGTLSAHYAATYPDRVAKLVFHSPGPIWMESFIPFEFGRPRTHTSTATTRSARSRFATDRFQVNCSAGIEKRFAGYVTFAGDK